MLRTEIKTPSQLKSFVEDTGSHFFDRSTMKFFGDTMRNFGLTKEVITVNYDENGNFVEAGIQVEAFALFRRKPTAKDSALRTWYFHPVTFKQLHAREA